MRYLSRLLTLIFTVAVLCSCEEVIVLDSPNFDHFMVVQATLTNQKGPQQIYLSQSQNYFDNSKPLVLSGASVKALTFGRPKANPMFWEKLVVLINYW